MMILVHSLNSKLVVRKWRVLLEQRFGNQNQDIEIPEVLKEDCYLGIHLFGLLEGPFLRHLVFACYFARQYEFSALLHEIAIIISI